METARTESWDNITDVATTEEEARRVRIGLHRPAESLLAENGKGISIVDENPAIDTGFHGNTANKFCNGFADTVNPTVLVGTNLETPVRVLELYSTAGEIVFEKISGKCCLA